jgi:hypothetical protein
VVTAAARKRKERVRQLEELEGMVAVLEQGSASLNQRATTLSSLAAAALGAFGIFASQVGSVELGGLKIAAAALLTLAALALLAGAYYALSSVRPAGRWSDNFARRAEVVAKGDMRASLRLEYLVETVQMQLERNNSKAMLMKKSYQWAAFALLAATSAVIVVLVDVMLR